MKKLILLSCLLLCSIVDYGQPSWERFLDTTDLRFVKENRSLFGFADTDHANLRKILTQGGSLILRPDTNYIPARFKVDTGYSVLFKQDTIYRKDTIRLDNIVGIYGDGSLHIFTAKMLVHKYYEKRGIYMWNEPEEKHHWGDEWDIIGGLKSVLSQVVGIYSYESSDHFFRTISHWYTSVYFKQGPLMDLKLGPTVEKGRTRVRRNDVK